MYTVHFLLLLFKVKFHLKKYLDIFMKLLKHALKNIDLRLLENGEILARTLSPVTNKCKLTYRRLTFVRPKRQFRK